MTTSIKNLYDAAFLAEVAYVDFAKVDMTNLVQYKKDIEREFSNGKSNLSEVQINYFLENFRVVAHQPNTKSGFSATVFARIDENGQDVEPYDYIFANRGTEDLFQDGLMADGRGIVVNGVAYDQIIDMYNFVQRITTPDNEYAKKAVISKTGKYLDSALHTINPFKKLSVDPLADATIANIKIVESEFKGEGLIPKSVKFNVAGHSLGGHNGTALERLFPDMVQGVITINGAGYGGFGSHNIDLLFEKLGGTSSFSQDKIQSLYGDPGINIVTQDWFLKQPGMHHGVFERAASHSSVNMTDGLALMKLITQLDDGIHGGKIADQEKNLLSMFYSTHTKNNLVENEILLKMADLFEVDLQVKKDPKSNELISVESTQALTRNQYHEAIHAIETSPRYMESIGQGNLVVLNQLGATDLAERATNDPAYAYALKNMNPFALVGIDYAAHNQNGELTPYTAETPEGRLTPNYLADRAEFLTLSLNHKLNNVSWKDTDYRDMDMPLHDLDWRSIHKSSDTSGYFEMKQQTSVVFGNSGELKEFVHRNVSEDRRLYGGEGDNVLVAGTGKNYLEGGVGSNQYILGKGEHTIHDLGINSKIILDGKEIALNATEYWRGDFINPNVWHSGAQTLTFNEGSVELEQMGTKIRIENFKSGDFNIAGMDAIEQKIAVTSTTMNPFRDPKVNMDDLDLSQHSLAQGNETNFMVHLRKPLEENQTVSIHLKGDLPESFTLNLNHQTFNSSEIVDGKISVELPKGTTIAMLNLESPDMPLNELKMVAKVEMGNMSAELAYNAVVPEINVKEPSDFFKDLDKLLAASSQGLDEFMKAVNEYSKSPAMADIAVKIEQEVAEALKQPDAVNTVEKNNIESSGYKMRM